MGLRSAYAAISHSMGYSTWRLRKHSGRDAVILMYHRVIPASKVAPSVQAGMVVHPDTLDMHIRYLRQIFEIIPLGNLIAYREPSAKERGSRPRCILTFDDGWCDFYRQAFPTLAKYEVPATVFLPTDFIGTNRWLWTDRIGFLLGRYFRDNASIGLKSRSRHPILREILRKKGSYAQRLEFAIGLLKRYRNEIIDEILTDLADLVHEGAMPEERAFLSWEEVYEMFASGLIQFGSHSASHPILTTLSDEEVEEELSRSWNALISQGVADLNFMAFCYPNGNFSTRLAKMVEEVGYHAAVTTVSGWNQVGADPYSLRRIGVHQDITATNAMFGARLVNA